MSDTGSVKFKCEQVPIEISRFAGFAELNRYRRKLLALGMIGVDASGVGFGNLSIRNGATSRFLHHRLGNCGDPGADAGGLRESGCLRFRKELASMRGINSCIIRIAYTCSCLRIGSNCSRGDPLS